jgi:XTP/dITP diphosphohydrolase
LAYIRNADDNQPLIATGVWAGQILDQPRGQHGFGYDPLFLPVGSQRSSAELDLEQKNRTSHRGQALSVLLRQLKQHGLLPA